jgi:phosphoadenosine phosphosulfate reductase
MVLLDLIAREGLGIGVFTLDTDGCHGKRTTSWRACGGFIASISRSSRLAGLRRGPCCASTAATVSTNGLAQRKACCAVRKNEPLERALRGKRAWITGLRRGQSEARAVLEEVERDEVRRLWKFNPLAEWTAGDVWAYLRANNVPYNALHDRATRRSVATRARARSVPASTRGRPLVVGAAGLAKGMRIARDPRPGGGMSDG